MKSELYIATSDNINIVTALVHGRLSNKLINIDYSLTVLQRLFYGISKQISFSTPQNAMLIQLKPSLPVHREIALTFQFNLQDNTMCVAFALFLLALGSRPLLIFMTIATLLVLLLNLLDAIIVRSGQLLVLTQRKFKTKRCLSLEK